MSDLADLCTRAVAAASGGEGVEAYAEEGRRTSVRARGGEVEELTFAESRGVGVRVIAGGRVGYAYAADPDAGDMPRLVEAAREAAAFAEPDDGNVLPALQPVEPIAGIFLEAQATVLVDRKVQLALDVERAAVSSRPHVTKVESAGYGDATIRVVIGSTEGGPVEFSRTDAWASVTALAELDGESQTGFAHALARGLDDLDGESVAVEAAERGARLLGGVKPPTERVPVVLDPVSAASFLSVLAGALSAESVLKGRSLFAGREGSEVGGRSVNLVDDGRLPDGPATAPFDDEGVATGRTALIEEGRLRGFLHNAYTAARSQTVSTGNAGRGGYRTVPGVSPSNLHLAPGQSPPDEVLRSAGRAVYVQEVTGLHSGANPISGEFSVGAVGLRVQDGALGGALREMTIASTLIDVLRGIAVVGADLRFFPWGGGVGSPTILVETMTIGGT